MRKGLWEGLEGDEYDDRDPNGERYDVNMIPIIVGAIVGVPTLGITLIIILHFLAK